MAEQKKNDEGLKFIPPENMEQIMNPRPCNPGGKPAWQCIMEQFDKIPPIDEGQMISDDRCMAIENIHRK